MPKKKPEAKKPDEKKPADLTTAEAIAKLFPKPVSDAARRAADSPRQDLDVPMKEE